MEADCQVSLHDPALAGFGDSCNRGSDHGEEGGGTFAADVPFKLPPLFRTPPK